MISSSDSSLSRRFWRLSAINILTNLTIPLAGLADIAFLGHLHTAAPLAGVTLGKIIFDYLYWSLGFLRMGTTGLTAQAVGRGDEDETSLIGLRAATIALVAGGIILLFQKPIESLVFALLAGAPEIEAVARGYYQARIWGAPAALLNFVLLGWFLGREKSGSALLITTITHSFNILLNYFFIVRWGWGATGAGLATMISQYVALLIGLLLAVKAISKLSPKALLKRILLSHALKAFFALNGWLFIRTLLLITVFALFVNFSATLGTTQLAASGVLLGILGFVAFFIDGYAFATETLGGMAFGAHDPRRLGRLLRLSLMAALGTSAIFTGGCLLFPDFVFGLLTDNPNVLQAVREYAVWLLPILSLGAVAYILDGYFIGLTQGRALCWSALASFLGFLPLILWAHHLGSLRGQWLALTIFMALRAAALGVCVPKTLRTDSSHSAGSRADG